MTPAHNLIKSVAEKIPLPEVYHSIKGLVVTPDAKIEDFVEVINRDPALATRIIRMANSQFFGYSRKARTCLLISVQLNRWQEVLTPFFRCV